MNLNRPPIVIDDELAASARTALVELHAVSAISATAPGPCMYTTHTAGTSHWNESHS